MDHNAKPSAAIDAPGSSASSLASFVPPAMNPSTDDDGPINLMPNELMQVILAKLTQDGNVHKLIRLRLVSTKWRALVEDYCARKKSLTFVDAHRYALASKNYFQHLGERFFGFANLRHFARLFLSTKVTSKCLRSLLKLFPNVVQLAIDCHDDETLISEFVEYINSLVTLKQLDLVGPFDLSSFYPTLSQLEHLSLNINKANHLETVAHFGPGCVRLHSYENLLCKDMLQWPNLNPAWLANVTHLRILIEFDAFAKIVHLLSQHAVSLSFLDIESWDDDDWYNLTPTVVRDLSQLTNLTEFVIPNVVTLSLSELDQAAVQHCLGSISSLLKCKLSLYFHDGYPFRGGQFVRIFSIIFPNVTNLNLCLCVNDVEGRLHDEIEQHLARFPNMRQHNIDIC